jgi:transcriptional regulator with XRE-family HTH domain
MEKLKPGVIEKSRVNRLRELRDRRKLSQTEIGMLLGGRSPAVVSRHENTRKKIAHDTIVKYAEKIYKVDTYELFTRPGVPIAVCNGIDPSLCRGSNGTVSYTTTQPIHARGRWSEEWVNCTDYRYRSCLARNLWQRLPMRVPARTNC